MIHLFGSELYLLMPVARPFDKSQIFDVWIPSCQSKSASNREDCEFGLAVYIIPTQISETLKAGDKRFENQDNLCINSFKFGKQVVLGGDQVRVEFITSWKYLLII